MKTYALALVSACLAFGAVGAANAQDTAKPMAAADCKDKPDSTAGAKCGDMAKHHGTKMKKDGAMSKGAGKTKDANSAHEAPAASAAK